MNEKYVPGEHITITIDATVLSQPAADEVEYQYPTMRGKGEGLLLLDSPNINVERADPEWWPPRPGDLLRTPTGMRLFAVAVGSNTFLISPNSEMIQPQEAWEQRHDLTLVHREDEDGGRS